MEVEVQAWFRAARPIHRSLSVLLYTDYWRGTGCQPRSTLDIDLRNPTKRTIGIKLTKDNKQVYPNA